MQGLQVDAPVIYLGTFSKSLFPALRIAYMVLPLALLTPLQSFVARSSLRGRFADQYCLAQFIRDGHFAQHVRRMRRLYRQRRDVLVAEIQTQLGDLVSIHGASAGMHLALRFASSTLDDQVISDAALEAGIVAPALSRHQIGKSASPWRGLMLGYAQVPVEQIPVLLKKLANIIRLHQKLIINRQSQAQIVQVPE